MDEADLDGTLWDIGPHTPGKHIVLKRYLDAWFPILGRYRSRILFVDGFAGPGRYRGGEDGSPVIALKTLRDHPFRARISAEIRFLFIEKDPTRAAHLEHEIAPLLADLGPRVTAHVHVGEFDASMKDALRALDEQRLQLAPAFVMVDPFGISQTPYTVLERILRNPQSELYVSFMWEFFNRFNTTREFPPHLDALFGCQDWRQAAEIPDWRRRRDFVFELYKRQLKNAGANHVVHFELYDRGTLVYAIFFATKHALGCDKMKEAIWKADPFGGCAFVGGRDKSEGMLFGQDLGRLKAELRRRFGSGEWYVVDELEAWIKSDETDHYSGQLRTALQELEREGLLEADPATRRRPMRHPPRTRLRLVPL